MFRSFRLGSAFGIPLYLHPTFLLLPLYVLFVSRAEGWERIALGQFVLFTIFTCVLLHELGHALMARFFRIHTRDITLYPIGGVARLESTGGRPGEEIAIALAGPAVNLAIVLLLSPVVLAVVLSRATAGEPLGFLGMYVLAVCAGNVILLLFNLIPAFPMDGGRVLRAVLSLGMPRLKATEIAAALGLVAAGVLALVGAFTGNLSLFLVALFVGFAGQAELRVMRHREAQRLQAEAVYDPIELPPRQAGGFTGLAWDSHRRVWVRWIDGVPTER